MYSYLHNKSGDTLHFYHACQIFIDKFSASHHDGDAMVVFLFALCSELTIENLFCAGPAIRVESMSFSNAMAT